MLFNHVNGKCQITVDQSPFIDSVFTPDGGDGSVQVSSVGHVFDNCPDTSGWIDDSNIFNGDTIKLGKLGKFKQK